MQFSPAIPRLLGVFGVFGALTIALLGALASPACAQGIKCVIQEPVAVRGGVLLLPLGAQSTEPWPESMSVTTEGGAQFDGLVAFVIQRPDERVPFWTQAVPFMDAVAPAALSKEAIEGAGPVLLLRLPENGGGSLRFGEQTLAPRWLGPLRSAGKASEVAPSNYGTPDPRAPTEMFRWDLLGSSPISQLQPEVTDERSRMLGEYFTGLWRAAFERLNSIDLLTGSRLCQALCGSASGITADGKQLSVAAWRQRPEDMDVLLSILLDDSSADSAVVNAVQSWLGAGELVNFWIESRDAQGILVGLASPCSEAIEVTIAPAGLALEKGTQVTVGPQEMRFVHLDASSIGGDRFPVELAISQGGRQSNLLVAPAVVAVRPPGLALGLLQSTLRLAEVQSRGQSLGPAPLRATASLRKRPHGWEVFVECLCPEGVAEDIVILELGSQPRVTVRLNRSGLLSVSPEGTVHPEVFTWSGTDRWRARMLVPADWVGTEEGGGQVLPLAIERVVDGARQTGVRPIAPWNEILPRIGADLSVW